ncbi:rapid alkalinization factor-like [Rhodamnia argentea]|uniref:Rapid alkalinization factor-like n=1 Tax=Rhodamnia argentea TaxID=178133 RepID=A0A8B8PEN0_9MYRT|nr:rapid alkalinization factor-like [Rhodamnia argentea]
MASSSLLALHILFLTSLIVASISTSAASAVGGDGLAWVAAAASSGLGPCRGSVAECMADQDGEFAMDTEVNRRVLATTQYISYGALQRNTVPCSQRGASYYNCQQGAQANPYSRSCSAVTQCRS